jgi:hypothetical protein
MSILDMATRTDRFSTRTTNFSAGKPRSHGGRKSSGIAVFRCRFLLADHLFATFVATRNLALRFNPPTRTADHVSSPLFHLTAPSNCMQESISIIVPVRDRQSNVGDRTEVLLERVSELSRNIQLILVDDFSSDATPEVLDDLRRKYPQVEVIRNRKILGPSQSAEQALYRATGEFIFLHPSYEPVNFDELIQLWRLRRDDQLVVARASTRVRRIDTGFMHRLKEWSSQLTNPSAAPPSQWNGLHMVRRSGIKDFAVAPDGIDAVEFSHQSHRRLPGSLAGREQAARVR